MLSARPATKILFLPSVYVDLSPSASTVYVARRTQLNMGYCTLLKLEELQVIPPDEVRSVSVQLVTYNGNQKSAYGTIYVDFDFEDGEVSSNAIPHGFVGLCRKPHPSGRSLL